MITLTQTQRLAAPLPAVWNLLVDTPAAPRWAGVRSAVIEREGDGPSGITGQIRAFTTSAGTFREEVTLAEPERRLSYRLISGAPVHDHRGTITLVAHDGGTELTWVIEIEPKWYAAPVLGRVVRRTTRRAIRGLATELESSRPYDA